MMVMLVGYSGAPQGVFLQRCPALCTHPLAIPEMDQIKKNELRKEG